MTAELPRFFPVEQDFPRPKVEDIFARVQQQLGRIASGDLRDQSVAVTVGSRGIASIETITRAVVARLKAAGARPFLVPAMGSHGGATALGQVGVLERFGITEQSMDCPIRSSMDVVEICRSAEGFPVYIDKHAAAADRLLIVNRIKPHTRFAGAIESGLMKMMLIGLGKKAGAELYHRAIVQHSFDKIVRSVSSQVIAKCNVIGGLAIVENAYEETADIVGLASEDIQHEEPQLLQRVKQLMPRLPFDHADLLMVDAMGKDISGTGLDTNIVGRKRNDNAAIDGDVPNIHHIYVRSLTDATFGNASGIGVADLCHRRILDQIDLEATRTNCITAGHISGAKIPVDFQSDHVAIQTACKLAGLIEPKNVAAMWIRDTLSLSRLVCSEPFLAEVEQIENLKVAGPVESLQFDSAGELLVDQPLQKWLG